ncbi:hypothetical protein HaLaN_31835, partial [Haematococcus lacustris]
DPRTQATAPQRLLGGPEPEAHFDEARGAVQLSYGSERLSQHRAASRDGPVERDGGGRKACQGVYVEADRASKDARLIVMDPTLLLQTDVEVAAPAVGEGVAAAATGEGWAVASEGDAMPKKATAAACLSSLR